MKTNQIIPGNACISLSTPPSGFFVYRIPITDDLTIAQILVD